ncbi:MAG: MCE family protein [Acidobacteria bacterium]|nr:MCE family protein [Acidobacteriota bacterium]
MIRAIRLGIFVFSTLLILFAAVFLVGRRQSLFTPTYKVKATFRSVAGLGGGADIRMGGVHQGNVARIDLPRRPTDEVVVVMNLNSATRDLVKKDSVAAIRTDGLLGDKYVEVSFGSEGAEKVQEGDLIKSEPPFDMADLLKKASEILDSTKTAAQNAEGITSNLKSVSSKIDSGQGTMGALIHDRKVYNEAAAGVESFRDNMNALKQNFFLRGFYNRRGYVDSAELTKHEVRNPPAATAGKTFTYETKRLFGKPNSAKLKNQKTLDEAGKFLEENTFALVVVEATSGPTGDSEKERLLTQAQSVAIRNYLADNFKLDDTRIKTLGRGKALNSNPANQIQINVYTAKPESARLHPRQKP